MNTFIKQPSELLDYTIDLTDWLSDEDTISGSTEIIPDNITLKTKLIGEKTIKLYLKDGQDREVYKITSLIETTGGLKKEVDFQIKVKDQ